MKVDKTADDYFEARDQWGEELRVLRRIMLSTDVEETIKWGAPAYTVNGKNIIGLGAFKSFFAIWFHQGALLSDKENKLINAQEGQTKALRQWRFSSIDEIDEQLVMNYVLEAIANQKEGKVIKPAKKKPLIIPDELSKAMEEDGLLKERFDELGLTKQREFVDSIAGAKREETRIKRLEKAIPLIRAGKGLYDKYKIK